MSETTRAMPPAAPSAAAVVKLEVTDGPDAGKSVVVHDRAFVGTSERADLVLTDPTVSRRHLEVVRSGMGVVARDEGSRNGTWLGNARVVECELAPAAELRIGGSTLRVVEASELRRPASDVPPRASFGSFLGAAHGLQPLYRQLVKVAPTTATVLLEGESGTGKELLSEAIHDASDRENGPFVVVDCGSIPETLIESELFGHERGAFTGATSARAGAFERAQGGTIFLDEIGELPLAMQTRLLRALDRKTVRRVGAQEWIDVDVRVVAATNKNLEREVEQSRFRLDLLHRLSVIQLRVPPLREREGDLGLLCRHFAHALGGDPDRIEAEVARRAVSHAWPGNVRELRNLVERLVLLGEDAPLSATSAVATAPGEDSLRAIARAGLSYRAARAQALDAFNRAYTEDMLARHGGNLSQAAKAAGVARRHFYRLRDDADEG